MNEDYFEKINKIAKECFDNRSGDSIQEVYLSSRTYFYGDKANLWNIQELIDFRKEISTPKDEKHIRQGLYFGDAFREIDYKQRIIWLLVYSDIISEISKLEKIRICEKYKKEHSLFIGCPKLFNHLRTTEEGKVDYELLDFSVMDQVGNSEIIKYKNKYAKMNSYLRPDIVSLSKKAFPTSPIYIRLDHENVYNEEPNRQMNEEVVIPPNRKWWKNLELHKKHFDDSQYILKNVSLDGFSKNNPVPEIIFQQHYDYNILNIRKLNVSASRSGDGSIEMSIEEIPEIDKNSDYMLTRMIHLDSFSPYGTPFEEARLKHLDLAINIYMGDKQYKRFNKSVVEKGEKLKADHRTHLFRIENIPFTALLDYYSIMFFKSSYLVNEWLENQFKGYKLSESNFTLS